MDLLWPTLNWHPVLFVIAVIASIIVFIFARATGMLVLAFVLYVGVDWDMWPWFSWVFWIVWSLGVLAVLVSLFSNGGRETARRVGAAAIGLVVLAGFLNVSINLFEGDGDGPADDGPAAVDPTDDPTETEPPVEEEPTKCASTWRMRKTTPRNGDWVNDVPSIRQADTKAEARAAADDWLDKIKGHPETLKGAAAYILDEDVRVKVLVNGKGCATGRAENLVQEIETALALATITPAEAPANGYNSFTNPNTGAVFAEGGPIGGDRSAVKIVLLNGKTVWVMARCGNPVTKTPPPIEHEPPDNNPPECRHNCNPPPPPECPPGTVPYDGRCVKPEGENDPDGTGGNDSPMSQDPQDNPQGDTPGAPDNPPPPQNHNGSGDDNGTPGDGGAGPPQGPSDDDHADDDTTHTDSPECPFGPGNC